MKKSGKKEEHVTSLYGDVLVTKTHDRIIFRGALDTLEAEVIEAQILAAGEKFYCDALGEILGLMRSIMKAEVTGSPLEPFTLFGLDGDEIHRQSHSIEEAFGIKGLPLPQYKFGPIAIRLNYLRARVREAEIIAVRAYEKQLAARTDIITAMNRLSSALWWLYCRYFADKCNGPER